MVIYFPPYSLTVLDCMHTLSPEHPYPADMKDARGPYAYVLSNPYKHNIPGSPAQGSVPV